MRRTTAGPRPPLKPARSGCGRLGRGFALVVVLGLLGACGASPTPPDLSPTPAASSPTLTQPGACLNDLDYTHGPADRLCLPLGVTVEYRYDGDKTLIVLGPAAEGPTVLTYIASTLPELGWTVTATATDALRFDDGTWQGSFVIGETHWGLTVRAE